MLLLNAVVYSTLFSLSPTTVPSSLLWQGLPPQSSWPGARLSAACPQKPGPGSFSSPWTPALASNPAATHNHTVQESMLHNAY